MKMPLVVGDSFKSYKDLEDRIHDLQNKESLSLWRRDSRTIEKAKAKGLKRHINAELVYYSVQFACYHGGRKFKTKSAGVRVNHRYSYLVSGKCVEY